MKSLFDSLTKVLAACSALATLVAVQGDDGMFPMSELPRINLQERGIELTADQLFNPNQTSLVDGICRVNGCTGSFVSNQGLIITNHHCAFNAIQKASTAANDLLNNGFIAKSMVEEIPAPDYQVRITEDYRDVSSEVLAVVIAEMSFLERTKAIDKRRKELEVAAEKADPRLRAEVAEMFAGKTYVLFLYTYLKDVRLVFAPPVSIGSFGGEVDNWEWPRHTGDFSFMRAYTAPDGSSATYSKDNIPYQPKRFVKVQPSGVDEGDAVFLLGYPGRTARHKTASYLAIERDVRLPLIVDFYQWQIRELEAAGELDRSVAIKHATRIKSLANVEKRSRGQLQGLKRTDILQSRQNQEQSLQKYISEDPARQAKYGQVISEIDAVYDDIASKATAEFLLANLKIACRSAAFAYFLIDSAAERAKSDLERETPYMDRNIAQSTSEIKVTLQDWHGATDKTLLNGILHRMSKVPASNQPECLRSILSAADTIESKVASLVDGSRLADPEFFASCLNKSPQQLSEIDDPMLRFMSELYPSYLKLREDDKSREGQLGKLYGSLIEIKQQYLATDFVPDANSTLRFTSGHVRAYSPADAVIRTPISTLKGVIEKTTGVEPFMTPEVVQQKYAAREFGPFVQPRLGEVPVAILYDTDTTGGNSGSPVFNAKGELVGVNYDRCFEATINDFAWNKDYSRSIGVDIRYVLWITGEVYQARHLLVEMGAAN